MALKVLQLRPRTREPDGEDADDVPEYALMVQYDVARVPAYLFPVSSPWSAHEHVIHKASAQSVKASDLRVKILSKKKLLPS